ncbi:unnamed protein product, partial [Pelagomonas calceolata]
MVRPFIVKPVFTTWPTVPASLSSSGYSNNASCSPGSKASPTAPNSSTPCAPKALTNWPRVSSTPSIKDSSDASSPFAASKAYPRLSETSNRLFAKPCDAKSFAAWTSRLAILRVFSCSAIARSSWSFRSFFSFSSFSSAAAASSTGSASSASGAGAAASSSLSVSSFVLSARQHCRLLRGAARQGDRTLRCKARLAVRASSKEAIDATAGLSTTYNDALARPQ